MSNRKSMFLALCCVLTLALGNLACPSDDEDGNGGTTDTGTDSTADRGRDQTTPDVPAETTPDTSRPDAVVDVQPDTPAFNCSSLPTCATSGTDCTEDEAVCGETCNCVGVSETAAKCAQECRVDMCEEVCGNNEYCVGLVDQEQNPIEDEFGNEVGACIEVDVIECNEIATCSTEGTACTQSGGECGTDENSCACIRDTDTAASCYQLCLVEDCETPCTGDETCLELGYYDDDDNWVPFEQPDGTLIGICYAAPTGDQTIYEECDNADLACQSGLSCFGFCSQTCTPSDTEIQGDCPDAPAEHTGAQPACFLQTSQTSPTYCGYLCGTAGADTYNCPTGMACTLFTGETYGYCEWE